jgi:GNAT superfamily N-acetyltransferase
MTTTTGVVRAARPGDAKAVRRIVFDTLAEYGQPSDPDGQDGDVMDFGSSPVPAVVHLVLELHGEPAGCAILLPHDAQRIRLSKLVVPLSQRGRGYGRRLLREAAARARECGYREIFIVLPPVCHEAAVLCESEGWLLHSGEETRIYRLPLEEAR